MAKCIKIVSKKDGFRRCGVAHHGTSIYPLSKFTKEQVEALKSEPNLVVEVVEVVEEGVDAAADTAPPSQAAIQGMAAPPPKRPSDPEVVIAAIVEALPCLDAAKAFNRDGLPKVGAVNAALGYNVTGEEVRAAWESHLESQQAALAG